MKNKKVILEVISYVVIVLLVIGFKVFIASPIRVNGSSMYKTLHDKDIMILNEFIYRFEDIRRFDIVVVEEDDELLIKRVIGLPGEKIECRDDVIYIDGEPLKDKYAHGNTADFDELELEKDEYFLLGDNREVSLDSRVYGPYTKKDIKGQATFTVYPFNRFGSKE